MEEKTKSVSEDIQALKRRIAQTFELDNLDALTGVSEHLRAIGYRETASALEQLMDTQRKISSGSR